ncbi:hypothetical protein [Legionella pneumophila]|uniref:hypothetical protein n=1 Tax=Legionella pneumophila TaxID=446 RepID=UPI0007775749|nr:hypothetical protein [Legionella pneumophila]MDW8872816.1 hypothetical protein [Legionella pneumophila]HAT8656785.1 hypothetical protein [Legionella pneumophila]
MSKLSHTSIEDYTAKAVKEHRWAATGVSDYPPRDPLVGQSTFFNRYKNFIQTIDHEDDRFAHVFAVEGEWGKGKSRLGYELIAQINDCSKGWFVRNKQGGLESAQLFDDEHRRDQYLCLYIRYSQVASEYQNSDNWFAYGLYKALLPLASKKFDHSIQSEIAKQALRRLEPMGFEHEELAKALELSQQHSDESLYYDETLATNLVQAAHQYLQQFGIHYVLVVLDELETVAEAATFGLERDEASQLDGQAIRLIGKAIKEEDPRRKLPWLRYVALCSPLLGQQLREIQSTARRFELVELEHNAFSDVSDYVAQLKENSKLRFDYPTGLVEAAYAMSGANFGWFNVIMANVDAVLETFSNAGKAIPSTGELFDSVLDASGRVARHVLDAEAIEGIKTNDRQLLQLARTLLFGQLPISLNSADERVNELLPLVNEYDEPVVSLYRLVQWSESDCRLALSDAKFQRDKDEWFYPSVDQGLNLKTLLQNLKTFAVAENHAGPDGLLIPLIRSDFKQLVALLYSHSAAEFAADALWEKFIGQEQQLPESEGTHIGPSVAMLLRLDLRYRSQHHNSMIFRDPMMADYHEAAMKKAEVEWSKNPLSRAQARLTGLFRLLDKQWQYDEPAYPTRDGLAIQITPRGQGRGLLGGLQFCDGLKLHPKGLAWFAWVNNIQELQNLHALIARVREDGEGRIPVMAFTGSVAVNDWYVANGNESDAQLHDDILIYHLNTSEIDVLERIGLPQKHCLQFNLKEEIFTTKFKGRLNSIRDFAYQRIHQWRHSLSARGLIAWPLRPSGKLNLDDRQLLLKAWKLFAIQQPKLGGLHALTPEHHIDVEALVSLFGRLLVGSKAQAQGYSRHEQAGLFKDLEQPANAQAHFPAFLAKIASPAKLSKWTIEKARKEWYWGYLWSGASNGLNDKNVFDDWMWWCQQLHLLKLEDSSTKSSCYINISRAELDNALTEANNWLEGTGPDDYPQVIATLEQVYGYTKIADLFAPKGKSPQGTQTTEALDCLKEADECFSALKNQEENLIGSLEDALGQLPLIIKRRLAIITDLKKVYPNPLPRVRLDNLRNISLEDKEVSLYERIERARLFSEFVSTGAKNINERVDALLEYIENDPKAAFPFPRRLFTLSLQTISNILQGALQGSRNTATQEKEAQAGSETLLHYLRSLQLNKASERLSLLAEEVGYDLPSNTFKKIEDISGYILKTYHQFLEQYKDVNDTVLDLDARIRKAISSLDEQLPVDYPDNNHPLILLELQNQLALIHDSFNGMEDEIDLIRQRFVEQTHRGQFSAITNAPEQLLGPIKRQLSGLGGKLRSCENALNRYRQEKLNHTNTQLRPLINPLLRAKGLEEIKAISEEDIKDLSLHDLNIGLDIYLQQWKSQAQEALSGTSVSLERWCQIAEDLLKNQSPQLSDDEQKLLVNEGILKIQLTFGGNV